MTIKHIIIEALFEISNVTFETYIQGGPPLTGWVTAHTHTHKYIILYQSNNYVQTQIITMRIEEI